MGDEDGGLLTYYELEKVAQKLVVGFKAYLMGESYCFLFSYVVWQVEVD